jgi:GT2 family glycosyltransferase/glycosyltransferase involved in cell wall biosynthesis
LPALIVSYTSHAGGAERILADHATAIGDDAIAACPHGWLADRLREQGVRVFPLAPRPLELRGQRATAALRLAGHAREVRHLVRSLRPHTLVAWGMRPLLACVSALPRTPGGRPRLVFQHNDLLPGPAVAKAVRAAAARADLVLALSEAIAHDLDPRGRLRVEVVQPGVDLDRFAPPAGPPPEDAPALFLAAIEPWKRPGLAIDAAARAGIHLILAGAPLDAGGARLEAELRARAAPGAVTFAGRVANPAEALRDASVLLHCADREPYGMALVEALACGVPVVAPAAAGPREIADDSCARLYRPGDAAAAAAALTAARDEREALSKAARTRAERHFDVRSSRRRYAELIATEEAPRGGAGIALVTVLHDSEREIRALMASIDRHLPGARLIAVDSDSSDGGPQAVRDWDGNGTLLEASENVGYGRGTNIGVRHATEPVTVVVNPDVELLDGSLHALAAEVARHPDRLLAPLVLRPDGGREDSVHPRPGAATEIVRTAIPAPIEPWRADEPGKVGWAVGCCIAARTETLRRLGPFDERAFLYAEDMDLGLRAADEGVETWFWPHARVLHHRAHSTDQAFGGEPLDLLAARRREVIEERRGPKARRRDDLLQAGTFANRIVLKTLLRRPARRERRQLRALIEARRRGRSAR